MSLEIMKGWREHTLHRPDTVLGNFIVADYKTKIVRDGKIVPATVCYNPAFEHVVVEIGSNCIDNKWRSVENGIPVSEIRFTEKNGVLCFQNDGRTPKVRLCEEKGFEHEYEPSLMFGTLYSSTNFNDSEKRKSSGRNGIGAKATNLMSKWFTVEIVDQERGLFFSQTWHDNMGRADPPIIRPSKAKGYTKIEWLPDYHRFKMEGITPGVRDMLEKYLYEIAMISRLRVYSDDRLIPVRNIVDYAKAYIVGEVDALYISSSDSEIVVIPSPKRKFFAHAFTNGIPNPTGGVHVKEWSRVIFSGLTAQLNEKETKKETKKKTKKKDGQPPPKLTMADVQAYFMIFVSCELENPTFASQDKSELTGPKPATEVTSKHLNAIMKWEVIEEIQELLSAKILRASIKKIEGSKSLFKNIPKLNDANLAGTNRSHECTLGFTEGDSAKTFFIKGIEKGINGISGRDFFGVLPLRGKILNVRDVTTDKLEKSIDIQSLVQALGLRSGIDYSTDEGYMSLRYGNVMIVTDADPDGIHIEGLLHNFFHKLFPSLFGRDPSFIRSMRTPIVRVTLKDGTEAQFYRKHEFDEFALTARNQFKSKPFYSKGLGSSNNRRIMDTFGKRIIHYRDTPGTDLEMIKAFRKDQANSRKGWLGNFDRTNFMMLEEKGVTNISMSFSDFINHDLVEFSMASNERAIPHFMDGLKESQRKILYHLRQNMKLFHEKESVKTYQLCGFIAGGTEYTHGEDCIGKTINGMASDFIGSNNIALLTPDGEFGTRLQNGTDAASSRYTHTKLRKIVPFLFRKEDDPILEYIQGEDKMIEPRFYIPVIPLLLANGIRTAIGTGWSSKVPAYNPLDLVSCLRVWIKENLSAPEKAGKIMFTDLPSIKPWYQGFLGEIEFENKNRRYITKGVLRKVNDTTTEVTELPIGLSTEKFLELLKTHRDEGLIADFVDHSSATRVFFTIYEISDKLSCDLDNLKMVSYLSVNNMVVYDIHNRIVKYSNIDEIIYDFAQVRLNAYEKRKEYIINELQNKLVQQSARRRFVEEVIEEKIIVFKRKTAEIIATLTEREYPLHDGSYKYLFKMGIDSFTSDLIEKLDQEIAEIEKEIQNHTEKTSRDMWLTELDEFEKAYEKYIKDWCDDEKLLNCGKKKDAVRPKRARK